MSISQEGVDILRREIEERINERDGTLLSQYPIDVYISFFDGLAKPTGYSFVPSEAVSFCQSIMGRTDSETLEEYQKLALLCLMSQFERRKKERNITPKVYELFMEYFESVITNIRKSKKRYYLFENDAFLKDLAVCRMKLWPCGVELLDEHSGCPKSVLWKGSSKQFSEGMQFFLLRTGGWRPFYQTHFDLRFLGKFTPKDYEQLYLTIAELLEINPHVKGVVSASWWHDPALKHISPHLRFLTQVPEDAGAKSFFVEVNPVAVRDAIRFSLERTKLYEEGRYLPKVYLLVWARVNLLQWACRQSRP